MAQGRFWVGVGLGMQSYLNDQIRCGVRLLEMATGTPTGPTLGVGRAPLCNIDALFGATYARDRHQSGSDRRKRNEHIGREADVAASDGKVACPRCNCTDLSGGNAPQVARESTRHSFT